MCWINSIKMDLSATFFIMLTRFCYFATLFLLTATSVFAEESMRSSGNSVCPNAYQPGASFCPKPSELFRDDKEIWQTKSGWKANEPSFVAEINTFVGVQWKGVNIGRATCIYTGTSEAEFPVSLYLNVIVNNPKDLTDNARHYGSDIEKPKLYNPLKDDQSTLNCFSSGSNICDCPFYLYKRKQESSREVIFSIQKINGSGLPFMY